MSKKHVDEYFNQICSQYHEMLEDIRDLEKESMEGMTDPDRLDNMKKIIEPLMTNYERWSYMMFLLNQPNKKEKKTKYIKQNQKVLQSLNKSNSLEETIKENDTVLDKLKRN